MIFIEYKNIDKYKNIGLFKCIVILMFLISTEVYSQQNTVNIQINFDAPPSSYDVSKAVLKYDKDFAYSFTLDDGKEDSYSVVYPFYKGGTITGNGIAYPGLFYTDGCNNQIPFTAGVAITSVNPNGDDTHTNNPSNITWTQLIEMYNSGWYVFNHSYTHSTGAGTNYDFEISENVNYVKSKTGIDLTHFVVPSGDTNYISPAFNYGVKAVYDQKGFPGNQGFKADGNINLNKFGLYRRFLDDGNYNTSNITAQIDEIAGKSIGGNHYWYNDFTHKIGFSYTIGGLTFSTFEFYMNYIESNYGENGSDRIWMAPLQEVYEYIAVRDNVIISHSLNGNILEISLDFTNVPSDLRKYAVSLVINADQNFSSVDANGTSNYSFIGTSQKKLINLEWDQFPIQSVTSTTDPIKASENCYLQYMEIYPNPAVDNEISIKVDSPQEDILSLSLNTESGKEVDLGEYKINSGMTYFDVNIGSLNLSCGIYFIKLFSLKEKCIKMIKFTKY